MVFLKAGSLLDELLHRYVSINVGTKGSSRLVRIPGLVVDDVLCVDGSTPCFFSSRSVRTAMPEGWSERGGREGGSWVRKEIYVVRGKL